MTFPAPDPVASGRPYRILAIGGGEPSTLEQFEGETSFTISKDGTESVICGFGNTHETEVHFHEKDLGHSGKDVRTWHLAQDPAGGFSATPTATF